MNYLASSTREVREAQRTLRFGEYRLGDTERVEQSDDHHQ